jgi:hypothetical protein
MQKKLVLIICIVVVIIALVLLAVYLMNGGSSDPSDIISSNVSINKPEVTISQEPEDTTDSSVTIYVTASITGSDEIKSITLPNKQVVKNDSTSYEVTKNGEYTFIITSKNGATTEKSITIDNISDISANNPYIPNGFTHIEGTEVETGYVIEDEAGNQYVWVPVETGALLRNNEGNNEFAEIDTTATALCNSVTKYYGFYIARYEASKGSQNGTDIAKSVEGEIPWSNVTYEEAYNAALNTATGYDYSGVKTALVNSYAWDTTLSWLNTSVQNYSTNTSYGNYSGTILRAGETSNDQVNSICDMSGNLREWTTEVYYANILDDTDDSSNTISNTTTDEEIEVQENSYRVVRGGSANINKVANSRIGELESLSDAYWGFRIVLYKE